MRTAQLKSALQRTFTLLRWRWVLALVFCCCRWFYAWHCGTALLNHYLQQFSAKDQTASV
jgi:hypothetical protein